MLHPFTPFVTEEIWGNLKQAAIQHSEQLTPENGNWAEALIIAPWPNPMQDEGWEAGAIAGFQQVQEIVRVIRNVRAEKNVKPSNKITAVFSSSPDLADLLKHEIGSIAALASLNPEAITLVVTSKGSFSRPEGHIALVAGAVEIFLPIADLVDKQEEQARLEKELDEIKKQIDRLKNLLAGPFVDKAPATIVQKEREKLIAYEQTAEKIEEQLLAL